MFYFLKPTSLTGQITILTLCLTCCNQSPIESNSKEKVAILNQIDTSKFAILPIDSTQYWIFKGGKTTDLTMEDLLKIENILEICINEYNLEQEKLFEEVNKKHPEYRLDKKDFIINLKRYKRQYVAFLNSKGEKEVWVNCFCGTWEYWKTDFVIVNDGGNCFFNLKINLTSEQYYDLEVNGVA
jgi:hypothetical protein